MAALHVRLVKPFPLSIPFGDAQGRGAANKDLVDDLKEHVVRRIGDVP
jgi:hypothetical protein